MKKLQVSIVLFVSLIFVIVTPISAMHNPGDYSHANDHQKFKSANTFYKEMVSNGSNTYTEFTNATMNLRILILYKDLPGLLQNKIGVFKHIVPLETLNRDRTINLKRQVYFYLTSRESEFKYAIFDAETSIGIISGSASGSSPIK